MLEAAGLECVRGERTLFRGLALELRAGELLRVAGANGSGKTSLLRILCGLSPPSAGEVRWKGEGIARLREEYWRELIYVGHASALKDDLTPAENLGVACALAGMRTRAAEVLGALRELGLEGCEHLPVRVLSQGQRRRAALARLALGERAPLWVLDEPFAALDAAAMERMRDLLSRHVARGAMVVYTTHQDVPLGGAEPRRIDLGAGAP